MTVEHTSRIPGFYKRTLAERAAIVAQWGDLSAAEQAAMLGINGLSAAQADQMIENAVGVYALPLGIATNFLINNQDVLIPMVIEEPSVLAAVSNAARLFRAGGGFTTSSDEPIMIGQIQVLDLDDVYVAAGRVMAEKAALMDEVNRIGGSIVKSGGGAKDIQVRPMPSTSVGPMLIIHLLYDTRDAMGANAINTAVEHIAPQIEALTGGRVVLRILSNLTDHRKARAEGMIPASELATETLTGDQVVRAIVEAGVFAEVDPYRAATHNKGIMNGVDAVVMATGNDWRAIEAGAHAYAARSGQYTSLTRWWQDENGNLRGAIEMPLAVGIVGGATRVHPTAQIALKIMKIQSARQLAEIISAAGLAQNLAAMRALATEGIQRGHMEMHAKQIATAVGAPPELVSRIVQQMITEKNIRPERARALLDELRGNASSG
ncbi:MAG: hydroxymethylglutaryl-CoA reductase, degradative [Chloroflexi bacterium]|uniref:hydroxymethylglutaryl-CoA reductase, degradative n=1 Tax=Candidatus Flexifilum breve TaxID=3140694 RepID=UPI003134DFB5|nr:hydroxymethylglutaryl-CoA reductase, degradative [Chloroflexota bacterium]